MQGRHSQRETVAFVTLIFYGPRYNFTLSLIAIVSHLGFELYYG